MLVLTSLYVNYITRSVYDQMKHFIAATVALCGCQGPSLPAESPPPQPTIILILPPFDPPESLPPKPVRQAVPEFEAPGTFDGIPWECTSKNDCPSGLVCCGQAHLGSSCRDYCDPGLVSTICETDDECPDYMGEKSPCNPMSGGPPGMKCC